VHHNILHLQRVGRRDQIKKGRKKEGNKERKKKGRESTIDVPRRWAITDPILNVGDCFPDDTAKHRRRLEYWVTTCLGNDGL
jgi:hypothetical protein